MCKIILCLILTSAIGCKNKQSELTTDRPSQGHTSISQGARADTMSVLLQDSVDERGKPLPSIPIEEMTRAELTEYKQLLAERGFYDCCIEPSCRMCLFEFEECPCEHRAKKNEGVCDQCFDGWQVGKGRVQGIKPEDVKRLE